MNDKIIFPPYNLRCEYLNNPIEIDTPFPRFSWLLRHEERVQAQKAYQIIVSSQKDYAKSGNGDLWDSGEVNTENPVNITEVTFIRDHHPSKLLEHMASIGYHASAPEKDVPASCALRIIDDPSFRVQDPRFDVHCDG